MEGQEVKNLDALQSVNDNDQLVAYSPSGQKYGLISVGKINRTQWCGCRWRKDSQTTVGEPCGSLPKIEKMAELFGLGGYLVRNDHSRRKLSPSTHNEFADGGSALLDGSMGHYQWGSGCTIYYAFWEDETYLYEAVDTKPIPGQLNYKIPIFSRSCAGYATIDRTNNILVSYLNNAAQFRGGNNDASLDSLFNSQLGKPATNIAVPTAATYARRNGTLWFANERVVFAITAILKRIYFHNRSIQAAYNATLTADGLHQGGTGDGCGQPTDWNNAWHYYPYIPLNAGVANGDMTGTFSVNINDNGTTKAISGIPSFLGLKNDYKYLGCIEEDTLLVCNSDKSQGVYIENNIDGHTFDVTTVNGKMFVGTTPVYNAAGWNGIKKLIFRLKLEQPKRQAMVTVITTLPLQAVFAVLLVSAMRTALALPARCASMATLRPRLPLRTAAWPSVNSRKHSARSLRWLRRKRALLRKTKDTGRGSAPPLRQGAERFLKG